MSNPLVLIIDDNLTSRETLKALLFDSGYDIVTADSGKTGLEKAIEKLPDVILLDVMMPGMDGYEVTRQIRQDPKLSEVPIIMITALDDRYSRLMGLKAGADDFLSKPYDSMELEIRLRGLHQVARYRHLREEREKLQQAYKQLEKQNEELKNLSAKMVEVQETEQRRLAVELHDDFGQLLTGLKLSLEKSFLADEKTIRKEIQQALEIVNQLHRQVRELVLNLRPAILDDLGLFAALDWFFTRYSQQTGIHVTHNVNRLEEKRYPNTIETSIFRLVQEALTNVARHAEVKEVMVTVNLESKSIKVAIVDTGKGFNVSALVPGNSTGISGMRERVSWVGGSFNLNSSPGEGTIVECEFPISGRE
jgi:signal transduction histidine kinase